MRAQIAVYTSWARTGDRAARTEPARKALRSKFEREVDPQGVLPEAERRRRAEAARKAFYKRLALASVRARRKRAGLE